jgi:hypothetical protein
MAVVGAALTGAAAMHRTAPKLHSGPTRAARRVTDRIAMTRRTEGLENELL